MQKQGSKNADFPEDIIKNDDNIVEKESSPQQEIQQDEGVTFESEIKLKRSNVMISVVIVAFFMTYLIGFSFTSTFD